MTRLAPAWWLNAFILLQFACQAMLMLPLGSGRTLLRVATFASSLGMLVLLPAGGRPYPARWPALIVVGLTALGLFHPDLNTPLAGLGSIGLTLAVWCPAVWVGRITATPATFRKTLLLVWGFHFLSSIVGVLQVYQPDRFAPDPEFVRQLAGVNADGLRVRLADGSEVWRPMGLTDSPGGACVSGMFAVVVGLAWLVADKNTLVRAGGLAGAVVGAFCLYICQVRTAVVLAGLGAGVYVALMAARGRLGRAAGVTVAGVLVAAGGLGWAASVGDASVVGRLETLTADDPGQVYYRNRGTFLQDTVEGFIPLYPLGAGLGRWGMMYTYFGDPNNPTSQMLWAEIQPTAWVFDGGVPLLLAAYVAVLLAAGLAVWLAVFSADPLYGDLAAVVATLSLISVVNTLTYPVFAGQSGVLFWVLNAGLYAALPRGRRPGPESA